MDYRIERDTIGEMKVPADKHWGAQTQRSKENFPIGQESMGIEIIKAFEITKNTAALANNELGLLEKEKTDAICYAADEIVKNHLTEHFPPGVWQRGSGPQSNRNVNEVIDHVGNESLKNKGSECTLDP